MPKRSRRTPKTTPLEDARRLARFLRGYRLEYARLKPLFKGAPPEATAGVSPEAIERFCAWLGAIDPALLASLWKRGEGRQRKPRLVEHVHSIHELPARVWHGSRNANAVLLDGFHLKPAEQMGSHGKRGYGYTRGSFRHAPHVWSWWLSLSPEGRARLEAQTSSKIESIEDLGRVVSVLFVMGADPIYAVAYTPGMRGTVLELDPRRLPLFGFYEDPYVMGDPMGLILPARGYQGGPDAVVDVYENPWTRREPAE